MVRDELSLVTYRVIRRLLEVRRLVDVAAEFGLTQPAVSFHLRRFESHYGYKILKRTGNEMLITEAGEQALDLCRTLLGTLERFAEVNAQRQTAICLPPSFLADLIFNHRLDDKLMAQYAWTGGHASREDFKARRYGLVLRYLSSREERPEITFDFDMVWVGNPELLKLPRVPMVRLPHATLYGRLPDEYLSASKPDVRCLAETTDQSFLLEMVRQGQAVSYHPPHYAERNSLTILDSPRLPPFTVQVGLEYWDDLVSSQLVQIIHEAALRLSRAPALRAPKPGS